MIDLQTVLTYLTLISVPVGVLYHIMTLNNTRKTQQMQLETRQAQLLASLFHTFRSMEFRRLWHQVMVYDWKDFDDWVERFSERSNPEAIASFTSVMSFFGGIGVFVKNNYIDIKLVNDLLGESVKMTWERYLPIFQGDRDYFENPLMWSDFEFLYDMINEFDPDSIDFEKAREIFDQLSKQPT